MRVVADLMFYLLPFLIEKPFIGAECRFCAFLSFSPKANANSYRSTTKKSPRSFLPGPCFLCSASYTLGRARLFFISAFRTNSIFIQRNSAQRTPVNILMAIKFCRSFIYTTAKGYLSNIQLILQQVINNLYHPLHCHRFQSGDRPLLRRLWHAQTLA